MASWIGELLRSGVLPALGLAVDRGDLAGLHDLLEAPQVVFDLDPGLLAEEPGDRGAEPAAGGLVIQLDVDLGPPVGGGLAEADRAGMVDLPSPGAIARRSARWASR